MTLTSRAIAVQEQLKQWWVAFQRDPGSTVKKFITDLYYIPSCTKYPDDWVNCIVAVIIIAGILLLTSLTLFCLYKIVKCVRRRRAMNRPLPPVSEMKKREKEEIEKKKKARMHHMKDQKRTASFTADDLLSVYSENCMQYNIDKSLPDIGSRIEKYWYRVTSQEYYSCHILTIGCISKHFTDVENYINQQLSKLSHPNLQAINTIKFLTKRGKTQVAIIQPYWELGSLKDLIHRTQPVQEWAQKYNKLGEGLPRHKVALLGGQILEAVVYLYARGFNPLGHIQTGNIYMASENCCKLGGYENTLLQYRSRIYKTCAVLKCLEDIDVVMFGHVIYEMVVGKELSRLIPADVDLINVESDGCLEILEYIFDRREDGRFKRGIIKLREHVFFKGKVDVMDPSPSSTYTSVSSTHTSPSHAYSPLSPRDPGPSLLKKLPGPFSRKDKRKQDNIVISKPFPTSPSSAPSSYLRTTPPSVSRSRSFSPSSSADSAKHTSIWSGFSLALCIIISLYVVLYLLVILLVVLF